MPKEKTPANPPAQPSTPKILSLADHVKATEEKKAVETAQVEQKPALTARTQDPNALTPEMDGQLNALKNLKNVDELLKMGMFQGIQCENVREARNFISGLHSGIRTQLAATPKGLKMLLGEGGKDA